VPPKKKKENFDVNHLRNLPALEDSSSLQMIIEKQIKKKNSSKYHNCNRTLLFSVVLFLLYLMECAGCFCNFVQMTAEPGKSVAANDA
jgi:hypothetical protein